MDRGNHALWNTDEVPVVPAMISGTRASSMLSTRGMGAGWGRESSESAPAEEEDAPASSPPATSSMMSREPGDSSSPEKSTEFTLLRLLYYFEIKYSDMSLKCQVSALI